MASYYDVVNFARQIKVPGFYSEQAAGEGGCFFPGRREGTGEGKTAAGDGREKEAGAHAG